MPYLRSDGKTQVTILYAVDKPLRLDTVVASTQHADGVDLENMLGVDVLDHVVTRSWPSSRWTVTTSG